NVRLYPLPPCTPELQPAEHLWPLVREALANRDFDHLVGLAAKLRRRCDWMAGHLTPSCCSLSALATCPPALSTSTTNVFTPPGSAHRANSAKASPIRAAFAFGRNRHRLRPVAGRAKP